MLLNYKIVLLSALLAVLCLKMLVTFWLQSYRPVADAYWEGASQQTAEGYWE